MEPTRGISLASHKRPQALLSIAVLLAVPGRTQAQVSDPPNFPAITNSDYTIDLYQGSVIGAGNIIGMGGAGTAIAEGSVGLLSNPAAPAVRPATSNDKWDWDFHFDFLNPAGGSDFDNNGIVSADEAKTFPDNIIGAPLITAGLVVNYKKWGFGLSVTAAQQIVTIDDMTSIEPSFLVTKLSVARTFLPHDQLAVGVGIRAGQFALNKVENEDSRNLFTLGGASVEVGAVWRPPLLDLRLGTTLSATSVSDDTPTIADDCTPMDCEGYILPNKVEVPWQLAFGAAWRFAGSRWNRQVKTRWRDEKYTLVSADFVITGRTSDGHGIEAFSRFMQAQPSGRKLVYSFRLGSEYEWVPGWFRIRGGSYWEPGRYRDEGNNIIGGRLHITLGADVRLYSFRLWDKNRRLKLSLTTDGASAGSGSNKRDYGNFGLSLGLW